MSDFDDAFDSITDGPSPTALSLLTRLDYLTLTLIVSTVLLIIEKFNV